MRQIYRIAARKLPSLVQPGRYADGNNLFLQIKPPRRKHDVNAGRGWIMRYHAPGTGRVREMGLGSLRHVTLEEARERTKAAHSLIKAGRDPLEEKDTTRIVAAKAQTFGQYAEHYCDTMLTGLKNPKHRAQWRSTLRTYCKPIWNPPREADIRPHPRRLLQNINFDERSR